METDWVKLLAPHDKWNEKHIMLAFSLFGIPQSYLDIGSGTGAMVNLAKKLGVEAYGVDQIERDNVNLFTHNLTEPMSVSALGGPSLFKMVTSIEVAEHIPEESHDVFCDTIANHVKREGILIFTSAHPGQDGEGHIGVKAAPYWRAKFHDRGLSFRFDYTTWLALLWSNINSPLFWLPANLQVFNR